LEAAENIRKLKSRAAAAMFYLVIIALIGSYLRFMFVKDFGIFNFQFLLHSHSHAAMLGWVFTSLFILLLHSYLPGKIFFRKFNLIFWLIQLSVFGQLVTFAVQGYAAFSIAFSTLHIVLSYFFIYYFFRETNKDKSLKKNHRLSLKFIYSALFFLLLSSFGPWSLAVIVIKDLPGTDLYKQAIYFYLHFQYNGWFVFSLIGLILFYYEKQGFAVNSDFANTAFSLLFWANIPAYTLSLLGFEIAGFIWVIAFGSALVQFFGLRYLAGVLLPFRKSSAGSAHIWEKRLFYIFIGSLSAKYILQLLSSLPFLKEAAFISREVAIGYIHLVMLGVVSCGIFFLFSVNSLMDLGKRMIKTGIWTLLAGFAANEILLFYPCLIIWFQAPLPGYYYHFLFACALLMFAGAVLIFTSQLNKRTE
jgi:hypothetical protein